MDLHRFAALDSTLLKYNCYGWLLKFDCSVISLHHFFRPAPYLLLRYLFIYCLP